MGLSAVLKRKLRPLLISKSSELTLSGDGEELAELHASDELRRLCSILYSLDSADTSTWPGLQTYHEYICQKFETVGRPLVQATVALVTPQTRPTLVTTYDYISFLCDIADIYKRFPHEVYTVLDAVRRWLQDHGVEYRDMSREDCRRCCTLVSCALAWLTLMVDITPNPTGESFTLSFPDGCLQIPPKNPPDEATRPVSILLRAFGQGPRIPILDHDSQSGGPQRDEAHSDLIHVTSVSYAMLHEFGKVTIEWTDLLSCHLIFTPATRTLFLFRLPTFCALGCLQDNQNCLIDSLLNDRTPKPGQMKQPWLRFRREVLLSYRILFAQDKSSRELFKRMKRHDRETNAMRLSDPLLEDICTRRNTSRTIQNLPPGIWPRSCLSLDDKLREHDEYEITSDLPLLGARFLALQEFNLRQRPRNFWALWKDTRDRPKWYTFWVVLIVGGLTIFLTVAQLLVSLAQLTVQVLQSGHGRRTKNT